MILSILVIFSIVFYLNFRWKRRKVYKIANQLPGSNGYPIFGHMFSFLRMNFEDNLNETLRIIPRDQPITKVWTGSVLFVVIESPELSHQLLNSSSCLKIPFMFSRPFLARYALPISNGETWQRHRKILSHSFKVQVLSDLMPTINEKCHKLVHKMKSQIGAGEFNILHYIAAMALETTMKGSFYYDKDFYGNQIIDDMDRAKLLMIQRMARPWLNIEFLFKRSQLYCEIEKSFSRIHHHVDEIIKLHEVNRANGFESGKMNIIDQLMSQKSGLTREEIRDEIYIFLFAVSINTEE
jgi:cytochrome P450